MVLDAQMANKIKKQEKWQTEIETEHKHFYLIRNYLQKKQSRVRISYSFSNLGQKIGVPKGSVLGSLFFNILIYFIFLFFKSSKLWNSSKVTPIPWSDLYKTLINPLTHEAIKIINQSVTYRPGNKTLPGEQ